MIAWALYASDLCTYVCTMEVGFCERCQIDDDFMKICPFKQDEIISGENALYG